MSGITRYGYRDAINGFFEFPTDNARRILPKGIEPIEPHHGTSVLAVTVFDFHESEVGEYGEVVYAVLVPPLVRDTRLPKGANTNAAAGPAKPVAEDADPNVVKVPKAAKDAPKPVEVRVGGATVFVLGIEQSDFFG